MTSQDIPGPGYTSCTLDLAGGDVATLIHLPTPKNSRGAALYVHGFVDYFFQDHVAKHFTTRGYDFYAIDLRRYGRSIREGDIPWTITDLSTYYEELDLAVDAIRRDGHRDLAVLAHSTGGLITPLWLQERRESQHVDALVLNSPWLELQEGRFTRTVGTWLIRAIGRVKPLAVIPRGLTGVYSQSIHKSVHGEWDFNTDWKPLTTQPVRFGFMRAIRRGHARLHRGLDLKIPVLVMHSDKSLLGQEAWTPEAMTADTVLDVAQIEHWAPAIGPQVTTETIPGGMHDLFLSSEPVRNEAFAAMDAWLDRAGG